MGDDTTPQNVDPKAKPPPPPTRVHDLLRFYMIAIPMIYVLRNDVRSIDPSLLAQHFDFLTPSQHPIRYKKYTKYYVNYYYCQREHNFGSMGIFLVW